MSDERSRELDELAQRLFAAGRAERPAPALRRRLLMIEPQATTEGERMPVELASSGARRVLRRRTGWVRGLALAALLAGAAGLVIGLRAPARELSISAETLGGADSSSKPAPLEPAASEAAATAPPPPALAPAGDESARPVLRARAPRSNRGSERKAAPTPPRAAEAAGPVERVEAVPPVPSAAPSETPPSVPLTLLEEIDLLKRARSALRSGNGTRALELLDRHERERSGDSLIAESTLLRIEVLAALGRSGAASELAQRFVREHPNHALNDRARSFITKLSQDP